MLRYTLSEKEERAILARLGMSESAHGRLFAKQLLNGKEDSKTKYYRSRIRVIIKAYVYTLLATVLKSALKSRKDGVRAVVLSILDSIKSKDPLRISSMCGVFALLYPIVKSSLARKGIPFEKISAPFLAGFVTASSFVLFPKHLSRNFVATWAASRAVMYIANYFDDKGYFDRLPRDYVGAWMLFPFALGQLMYAFVLEPESCPPIFSSVMMRLGKGFYITDRPSSLHSDVFWPKDREVVDGIATVARLKYPAFLSPMNNKKVTLLEELKPYAAMIETANPTLTSMTSVIMHPFRQSEFHTYLEFIFTNLGAVGKYVLAIYTLMWLKAQKKAGFGSNTLQSLQSVVGRSLRTTVFSVMTVASLWSGIGVAQALLSPKFLPTSRFRIIGFVSGLWALLDQSSGQYKYVYAARTALQSHWDMLVKQGKVKPMKNGEIAIFAVAFAASIAVYENNHDAITGGIKKVFGYITEQPAQDAPSAPNPKTNAIPVRGFGAALKR